MSKQEISRKSMVVENLECVFGAGVYAFQLITNPIFQGIKHFSYHARGVEHRKVEEDPRTSFPYYIRTGE